MSLLFDNAIDSIDVGVADIKTLTHSRAISGLRNIYAGILLLVKEVLRQLSPVDEAFIKPTKGKKNTANFNTVDYHELKKRCESQGINIDWPLVEEIRKYRNNAEHYYLTDSPIDVRNSLYKSRAVIYKILTSHLKTNPSNVLEAETWEFLQESDEYKNEKDRYNKIIDEFSWNSKILEAGMKKAQCIYCGSELLELLAPEDEFDVTEMAYLKLKCLFCQKSLNLPEVVEDVFLELNPNRDWKCKDDIDYSEDVIISCPFCSELSYSMEEEKCMFCQQEAEHKCLRCDEQIPASEITDSNLCGYCQHMLEKNLDK